MNRWTCITGNFICQGLALLWTHWRASDSRCTPSPANVVNMSSACGKTYGLSSPLSPTVAQFISPPSPSRCRSMTSKSSELSGCWQMQRYYIYNKYFLNKLATLSLHQKSFINNNIINKIKCIYWINYKILIGLQRKASKC